MIQIISQKFLGNILSCLQCGCVFSYNIDDVYAGKVYCPICKYANESMIQKEEKND